MATHVPLARPWWLLPTRRVDARWWLIAGAAMTAVDYLAGPDSQFPVVYALPVVLAAWYSGRTPAIALVGAMTAAHVVLHQASWVQAGELSLQVTAALIRGGVVILIALWFARLAEHERELQRHVQRLEGLLPICSFCKSIRNKSGAWEPLEEFVSTRSEARFSHGFCPPCGKTHYDFELDDVESEPARDLPSSGLH